MGRSNPRAKIANAGRPLNMTVADDLAQQILSSSGQPEQSVSDMIAGQLSQQGGDTGKPVDPMSFGPPVATQEEVDANAPGFLERLGKRVHKRVDDFKALDPPRTSLESAGRGVQVLGNIVAGSGLDAIGEGLTSGFEFLSFITPDAIEDPVLAKASDAFGAIVGTDAAQSGIEAAKGGIEAYQAWAEENPELARNASAIGNIAMAAVPIKGKPARLGPKAETIASRAGRSATKAGEAQSAAQRTTFLDDLVRPKATKAVREAEIRRTAEGGLVSPRAVTPSSGEASIAQALSGVSDLKPRNTLLQNLKVIQSDITAEAKTLAERLKSSTVKISRPDVKTSMDDVITRLQENPLLVGDAAKTADRTVAQAQKFLSDNANSPAGVLKARQQFDQWVGNQRPKIFDPNTESALSIAVRETRQEMNDIIAKSVPDIGVKDSLARQSNMFRAIDNIAPKAADEAATAIGRLGQRVKSSIGLSRGITSNLPQLAGLGAVTGVGVASPAAVAGAAGLFALGVGAKRMATSAKAKKAVGALLKQSDRAIQQARSQGSGGADLLKSLRADRAAVIEVFRDMDVREEQ